MTDTENDEELDPAMEAVRRKLVRLLLISGGVMLIGFAAVILAVIYRVSESTTSAPVVEEVSLPLAAEEVTNAAVTGDRIVLTIGGAQPRIEVRRLSDGALLQTLTLDGPAE
ncbi:hypothetical protein L1787_00895 [Acuticoccus sp. M5D2P5]|uniref:DUF6476 family protein n=1 Tax=Acuticoccus kalidii TaxID=2910977 RepID=UPI001F2B6E5D|nr:DUF6476 family protein [Acuticoccus kalidii]MCF3931968.1 hypothetical protein [Acuticoccus kalidii]